MDLDTTEKVLSSLGNTATIFLAVISVVGYFKIKEQLSFATMDRFTETKVLMDLLRHGKKIETEEARTIVSHFKALKFQIDQKTLKVDEHTEKTIKEILDTVENCPARKTPAKHVTEIVMENAGTLKTIVVQIHSDVFTKIKS